MAEQPTPTQPLTNGSRTTIVNMKSNYIIFIVTKKKPNHDIHWSREKEISTNRHNIKVTVANHPQEREGRSLGAEITEQQGAV